MRTSDMFTLPVGLAALFGQFKAEYGQVMAGAVVSVIPVIYVFLRLQKQFIAGLTLGSVKG
jgi:ABC-type glycerol-3-phosphate transport system permease component